MTTKNKEQRTKKKLKTNHFKFLVMFLAFFLTVGCQEDLYNLEKKGTQRKQTISFSELKNRVDQKKVAYKGARSIFDKIKSNSLAKSASDFIQEVDTTNIIEIFKDGFSSFTLKVTTTDNDLQNLYNLVLVERNNEFKEILLKYHTNSTEELTPENFNGTVIAVNQDGIPTAIDVDDYDKTLYVECGSEIQLLCECVEHNPHCGGESTSVCPSQSGHVTGLVIAPLYCYINVPNGGDGNPTAPSTPSTPASPNNNNSGSNGINTTPNGGSNPASTKTKLVINKLKNPSNPLYSECYAGTTQEFKDQVNIFLTNEFNDPNQSATDAAIEEFAKEASDSQCEGGEVDFDYKVIIDGSLKNNPCLYGVYTQLGKAPTFQNYLQNFDGNSSVADLILTTGNIGNHAITVPPNNHIIKIIFDVNIISSVPALDVAGTFIHEMLHAEIFRKMLLAAQTGSLDPSNMTTEQQVNYVNNLKNNFPGLYDYYIARYHPDWTHQMMAQHYLEIIIDVLKEYDNTQSESVYISIAWVGLKGTGPINSLTGLPTNPTIAWQNVPQAERLSIINTYNNYINTTPPCQ